MGSGIFASPGFVLGYVGSPGAALCVWGGCGLITVRVSHIWFGTCVLDITPWTPLSFSLCVCDHPPPPHISLTHTHARTHARAHRYSQVAGSLSMAELSAALPMSGGESVYLTRAFHPVVGFMYTWITGMLAKPSGAAAISVVFADYLCRLEWGMCALFVAARMVPLPGRRS